MVKTIENIQRTFTIMKKINFLQFIRKSWEIAVVREYTIVSIICLFLAYLTRNVAIQTPTRSHPEFGFIVCYVSGLAIFIAIKRLFIKRVSLNDAVLFSAKTFVYRRNAPYQGRLLDILICFIAIVPAFFVLHYAWKNESACFLSILPLMGCIVGDILDCLIFLIEKVWNYLRKREKERQINYQQEYVKQKIVSSMEN